MRRFIRHPLNIPINVTSPHQETVCSSKNIGVGGLSFIGDYYVMPGTLVNIHIPYFQPPFSSEARVLWSREADEGTELGVEFLTVDDAYRARMVEQICHIESYRRQVAKEQQRNLTSHEAALNWMAMPTTNNGLFKHV
jgi:PilZ domain